MALTKDLILAANDRKTHVVDVPEWGGEVIVATMSGAARDAWEMWVVESRKAEQYANVRARLVAACLVDESGARLFSDDDVVALGEKNGAVLDRLFDVARALNGLSDGDLEALKKASASGRNGASGSG